MKKLLSVSLALAMTLTLNAGAQSGDTPRTSTRRHSMTLLMDWTRGDPHYGADFIQLRRPCEATRSQNCECVADFKVISSKDNSKEFADYVTSFEHGKVPVVYSVVFNEQGGYLGALLMSVGSWTRDRIDSSDGLLGIRTTFSAKGATIGKTQRGAILNTSDCFPPG